MRLNRYNFSIILQSIFLGFSGFLVFLTIFNNFIWITILSLVGIWILQITFLVQYVNRQNRELLYFIESFKNHDTSTNFNEHTDNKIINLLHGHFNEILKEFRLIRIEKEIEHLFFQNTIQHIGIGLLAFNNQGKVKLVNQAVKKLFRMPIISHIDALASISSEIPEILRQIHTNRQQSIRVTVENEVYQLALSAAEFKINNEHVTLVSFQDIKAEIEQSEMDAWRKMIRIMNHEIINSVKPITMLTKTLLDVFEKDSMAATPVEIKQENVDDLLLGLSAIQSRSKGLLKFVESYRNLTHIPKPTLAIFPVVHLCTQIEILFRHEFKTRNITFKTNIQPADLSLMADEKLTEQVIINLIKNSVEATTKTEKPEISITAEKIENHIYIKVKDNGEGIKEEMIEHVFMPFFSTKSSGSGIGLSLSRQIMRMHSGNISVHSVPDQETEFILKF
jgi:signal transduction histidine kinase